MRATVLLAVLGLIILTSCGGEDGTVGGSIGSLPPPSAIVSITPVAVEEYDPLTPFNDIMSLEANNSRQSMTYKDLIGWYFHYELFDKSSFWLESDSDNELAGSILKALRHRTLDDGNYSVLASYLYYPKLEINVFYAMPTEAPWGLKTPDFEMDEAFLNGPPLLPEASARSYFLTQSYGNFEPTFNVIKTPYSFDPEKVPYTGKAFFWDIPELREFFLSEQNVLVTGENETRSGKLLKPILYCSYPEQEGYSSFSASRQTKVLRDDPLEAVYFGLINIHISESWGDRFFTDEQISIGAWWPLGVVHEIGHLLSWPDTYWHHPEIGVRGLEGMDIMGAGDGYPPIGLHKVISGWTCFIHTKYDVRPLVVGAQDVIEGKRELYFLAHNPDEPAEFFYVENQAGFGMYPEYPDDISGQLWGPAASGLVIAHVDLTRDPIIEIPSNALPDELYPIPGWPLKYFFPYVAPSFESESIVKPKWSDGSAAKVAVRDIRFLDNKRYRPYLEYPWEDIMGYGDIICSVDVGNPLKGDLNGDGIVNAGDLAILKANYGKRVGVDTLAVPVDVNGDGLLGLVRDRDGDGFVSTSERIYDDAWELVHTTGDWLDLNADGRNDLDADGDGQWDIVERVLAELPESGITREYVAKFFQGELFQASSEIYGGVEIEGASDFVTTFFDRNADGVLDFFDADLDGEADLVPQMLDPNGDGVVNELDSAYLGYFWGETTFEELWLPLPAPESWD